MSLSANERETVILMNDEEKTAQVTSCQRPVWTRMQKLGVQPDKELSIDGQVIEKVFTVPKSWVKISPPRKVSDEQRQAAGERLKAVRLGQAG